METDRPLWRSRAWPVAAASLGGLIFILSTVAPGGQRGLVVLWGIALTAVLLIVVLTVRRVRADRARFERELAEWATERAGQAERLRIAGDLHDLVSHGIGLITLRAAAAQSVSGEAAAAEHTAALADIERTSRETTAELRRMLTVLREPGQAPLRPADTLADLPGIIATAESAGLTVQCDGALASELGEVSPGAQLTVCAVVREALNNAFRHAGPTEVLVAIHRERPGVGADDGMGVDGCTGVYGNTGEGLVVTVSDAGPQGAWRPEPGAGRGLEALRERVAAHGGSVEAGSHGTGFRVRAWIPDGPARG